MVIDNQMVNNLAELAKLHFNEQEKVELQKDLQSMIAFVEKLNEIDTTGVAPQLHMSNEMNVLREDEVKGSIDRNLALKNVPQSDGVYIKVPKVISK